MKYLTSEEITKAKKNISEIKPYKTTKEIIFSNIFTFFNWYFSRSSFEKCS